MDLLYPGGWLWHPGLGVWGGGAALLPLINKTPTASLNRLRAPATDAPKIGPLQRQSQYKYEPIFPRPPNEGRGERGWQRRHCSESTKGQIYLTQIFPSRTRVHLKRLTPCRAPAKASNVVTRPMRHEANKTSRMENWASESVHPWRFLSSSRRWQSHSFDKHYRQPAWQKGKQWCANPISDTSKDNYIFPRESETTNLNNITIHIKKVQFVPGSNKRSLMKSLY